MGYDEANIFARILKGEIPAAKVYEDEEVLAFKDIAPQARIHILVIPKGRWANIDTFTEGASDTEMLALLRAAGRVAREQGLHETGYRLIVNHGAHAHQAVPHLHVHLLGGEDLGPGLLAKRR